MTGSERRLRASQVSVAYLNRTMKSMQVQADSKALIVESRNEEWQRYLWDEAAKRRFQLNEAEADQLEHGAVLWRGSTAFIVERLF